MVQHLQFLLFGLANGGVFAALALGLVVSYRSSGVLNFATGTIALYAAYEYAFLREGKLLLLVPGANTVDLGTQLGLIPAMVIALAMSAALSLLLYALVFRPLRSAPPVARAVASIGLMVVMTGVVAQRIGTSAVLVDAIFPTRTWHLGSVRVPADRVWFAVTISLVALALAAVARFTRFGLKTRASAESEKGALLSRISPDRIGALNWAISGVVSGLAGILVAPIVPLVPLSYTLFIVPALAAALVARFSSVVVALVAGLAIGMLQSDATYLSGKYSWLPSQGLPDLIPLVLILLLLVVRARPLPTRGSIIVQTLGRAPRPRGLAVPTGAGTAAALLGVLVLHGEWRAGLVTSFLFGVIALSLVVVTGYAGQISLAQLTIAGAAGFLLGPVVNTWGVPFPIAPILAAVGAGALGVVVGLPALRVRGLPVAVVTLSLAVAVESVWFRNTDIVGASGVNLTGPRLLGLDLDPGSGAAFPRLGFSLLALITLVLVAVGVAVLRRSALGSAMLAVRANERSAAAAGVSVVRTKLIAFAVGAFIAGIGGALYSYQLTTVTFDSFDVFTGLGLFATVYLAGVTSVSGGILAGMLATNGLVYVAVEKWFSLGDWFEVVVGLGLVLTVVLNPEGIVGPAHARIGRLRRRAPAVPDDVSATPREPLHVVTAAPDAPRSPALSVQEVSVRYGGVVAVDAVSFDVAEGSIVGLIGPNGAGKTTLVDAISGFTSASGRVLLHGESLDGLAPSRRIRAGMGRTFQAIELYDDLSVRENVVVGLAASPGRARRDDDDQLDATFRLLGIADVQHRPAGELSQGQRQLVSIARALVARPRLLLLDEPAGGLDTQESQWLGERLRDIRESGVSILIVDHDMGLILSVCDRVVVVNFGRELAVGTPAEVRADPAVAEAYLGTTQVVSPAGVA